MAHTVTVCAGCGHLLQHTDATGNPHCPFCPPDCPVSGVPMEVELPDTIQCRTCGRIHNTTDVFALWVSPPFYDAVAGTFYDGCQGWD